MLRAEHGHDPVMLAEVLEYLDPQPGQVVLDCTVGRGGHSLAIAERLGPTGTLLAVDVDPENLAFARGRVLGLKEPPKCRWFHANFSEIDDVLAEAGVGKVDGLLADLGVSTNQLMDEAHGLSFATEAALDMRLDPRIKKTAADLLAELDERAIADILFQNAQERCAFKIARKIVQTRATEPIRTTGQLARLVRSVVPGKPGQIDSATRSFQALRMAVNEELESLQDLLAIIPEVMTRGREAGLRGDGKPGEGRVAIISFHSGEDRFVKQATREWSAAGWCENLTRKPREPGETELSRNPRSRSAKLRAVKFTEAGTMGGTGGSEAEVL